MNYWLELITIYLTIAVGSATGTVIVMRPMMKKFVQQAGVGIGRNIGVGMEEYYKEKEKDIKRKQV